MPGPLALTALAWYLALSVWAFASFALDKRAARLGARRTSERRLLGITLAGGFVGAWFAMRRFRHKTRRLKFRAAPFVAGAAHVGAWGAVWVLR